MWAVIPAAGHGTRLGAAASGRPKPLVSVGGRPILDRLLERLAGPVTDACLVVAGDDGEIRETLGRRRHGIRLAYAEQPEPRGAGDAILRAAGTVRGAFVSVMGDCWYDSPLAPHLDAWRASGAEGAVLVEPADGAGADPVGLVRAAEGRVRAIEKARPSGTHDWRLAGLAVLPEAALDLAPAPSPGTDEVEMEQLVTGCMERGAGFSVLRYRGWRRNINTVDDMKAVEERIAKSDAASARSVETTGGEGTR